MNETAALTPEHLVELLADAGDLDAATEALDALRLRPGDDDARLAVASSEDASAACCRSEAARDGFCNSSAWPRAPLPAPRSAAAPAGRGWAATRWANRQAKPRCNLAWPS
jgi:hypothetical protein